MTLPTPSFLDSASLELEGLPHLLSLWHAGANAQVLLEAGLHWLGLNWGGLYRSRVGESRLLAWVGAARESLDYQDLPLEHAGQTLGFLRLPTSENKASENKVPENSARQNGELQTFMRLLTLWLEADLHHVALAQTQQLEDREAQLEQLYRLGQGLSAQPASELAELVERAETGPPSPVQAIARALEASQRTQRAAEAALAEFEALQSLELELVAQREPRKLVERALELCCEQFGVKVGSYWRYFPPLGGREPYLELRLKVGDMVEPLNVRCEIDSGALGWVTRNGQALRIDDYWEYPHQTPNMRSPHRSLLLTPMVYSGKTLGVLVLTDAAPNTFTSEDLGRFQRFGRLVAVALHNARLFEQTVRAEFEAQRRADLLETLTEMSGELSQELEPTKLYTSILERLTRLFGAKEAALYLLSPERDRVVLADETGRHGVVSMKVGEGAAGRVALNGEALLLSDYSVWPLRLNPEQSYPVRSLMAVALGPAEKPLGVLVVADPVENRYTSNDLELLSRFAALATVALENAQLYQMTRLNARFERLRAHISGTVTASRSVREFCEKLLEEISNAFGYHYLYMDLLEDGPQGKLLRCQASLGYQNVLSEMTLYQGVGGRVARNGVGEWVPNAAADPDWIQADGHLNQQVCVPLKARGRVLGILGVESDASSPLGASDLGQLEAIAETVSFALENVLLVETLEKRTRELEKTHKEAEYAATHDVLTRLPNRRAFERDARRSLEQTLKEGGQFTLAVIDLSGFKAVNDRVGHSAGDHALQRIAHVLASSCPNAYRVGGDEFLLLLEMKTLRAIEVAQYVIERIGALEFDRGLRIMANVGLAEFPLEAHSLDALQTLADHRMYAAKRLNRPLLRPDELENLPTPKRRQSDRTPENFYLSSAEPETPEPQTREPQTREPQTREPELPDDSG